MIKLPELDKYKEPSFGVVLLICQLLPKIAASLLIHPQYASGAALLIVYSQAIANFRGDFMDAKTLTVTVSIKRKGKIAAWIYTRLLALMSFLGVIDTKTALQRASQYYADGFVYRVGRSEWQPLNLKVGVTSK